MNVICYSRVATPDQAQSGGSLDHQKSNLRDYCHSKNYNIVGEYSEVASGRSFNRPQWNNLMEFCTKNKCVVDLILFTSWDRFSRNAFEAFLKLKELENWGIEIYAIEQPLELKYSDSNAVNLILNYRTDILESVKEEEKKEQIRRAKLKGYWVGVPPIGYRIIHSEGFRSTITPTKDSIHIIEAFKRMASGNYSDNEVHMWLKSKGIKMNVHRFRRMIHDVVYKGKILIKGKYKMQNIIVDGRHSPIVSDLVFKAANKNLKKYTKLKSLKAKPNESNML